MQLYLAWMDLVRWRTGMRDRLAFLWASNWISVWTFAFFNRQSHEKFKFLLRCCLEAQTGFNFVYEESLGMLCTDTNFIKPRCIPCKNINSTGICFQSFKWPQLWVTTRYGKIPIVLAFPSWSCTEERIDQIELLWPIFSLTLNIILITLWSVVWFIKRN